MRKVDTGPLLKPDDMIRFVDSHRPVLEDGDYEITMLQEVGSLGISATRKSRFSVAGPRFALQPSEISSQFPPKGSEGDFETVLPHIVLSRPTLPWERSALFEEPVAPTPGNVPVRPKPPKNAPGWLALLVFSEDEIAGKTQIVEASELMTDVVGAHATPPANGGSYAMLSRASSDDLKQPVLVLDLPTDLVTQSLPRITDLEFLTSARMVNGKDGRAVVMAHRLPVPGKRNFVHLVSVEHQYRLISGADRRHKWTQTHEHWSRDVVPGSTMRLVSMANWDFFCDKSEGDLQTILGSLKISRLSLPTHGLTSSQSVVYSGRIPVEHRLSSGEKTAAWYGGPFHPIEPRHSPPLPVRRSSDLVLIDGASGLADITYSAAWELGRLLALEDPSVGIPLNKWKRQVAHAGHAAVHSDIADELEHQSPASPILPQDLTDWFEHALARFGAVPFDYLVSDAGLLPQEHIAWFCVDKAWVAALFDGAFSIGRTSQHQLLDDSALRYALPRIRNRSGILLRSSAVSGWSDLIVDGLEEETGKRLDPIRQDYIGPDTLLVLFDGYAEQVSVHLHPQAMHLGFDGSWEDGLTKAGQPVHYHAKDERIINVGDLAATALNASGAHDFSLNMIEGVPKVSFGFRLHHG